MRITLNIFYPVVVYGICISYELLKVLCPCIVRYHSITRIMYGATVYLNSYAFYQIARKLCVAFSVAYV
jgi:hypothetical protein